MEIVYLKLKGTTRRVEDDPQTVEELKVYGFQEVSKEEGEQSFAQKEKFIKDFNKEFGKNQ